MITVGDLLAILKLQDEMSPAVEGVRTAMGNLDESSKMTSYQITLLGRGMREAGTLMTGALTVPIVAAATAIIKFGGDFESTTAKLTSLAAVQKGELDGVKQHILDLAPAVGIGPVALADAMYRISSTVADTKVAMEILDIAAKGSAAGMGEASVVATALTAVINSYGKENITAKHAIDVLTRAIQDGGAEAKDLAPILANVVPFAAKMGVSLEEVGANFATITKLGVPASEAVTQLTSVFAALTRETPRGTRALKEVGMSYTGLKEEIREKGLHQALLHLTEAFAGNEKGLFAVLGRLEALKNIMSTTGAQADTYVEEVKRMKEANGTFNEAFKTITDTMKFQWSQLTAAVEVAAVRMSQTLIPMIKSIVAYIKEHFLPTLEDLVKKFADLPQWAQIAVVGLAAFLAAIGPILIVVGQLIMAIGNISRAFGALYGSEVIGGLTGLTTGIAMVDGALVVTLGTLNLIIPGWTLWLGLILGIAAALITWTDNWGPVLEGVKAILEPLGAVIGYVKDWITWLNPLWQALYDIGAIIGNSVIIVFNTFVEAGGFFIAVVKDIWNNLKDFAQWVYDHSGGLGKAIKDMVMPQEVIDQEQEYWNSIKTNALGAFNYIANLRKQTADAASGQMPGAPSAFQPTAVGGMNPLNLGLDTATDILENYGSVLDGLPEKIEKVKETKEALTAAEKKLAAAWEILNDLEAAQADNNIVVNDTLRAQIEHYIDLGASVAQITAAHIAEKGVVMAVAKQYKESKELEKTVLSDWNAAIKQHNEEYKEGEKETLDFLNKLDKERMDAAKAKLDDYAEVVRKHNEDQKKGEEDTLRVLKLNSELGRQALGNLVSGFTKLGEIAGGTLGSVISGIGQMVVNLQTADKMVHQIGGSIKNLSDKNPQEIGGNWGAASVVFSDTASHAQKAAAAVLGAVAIIQGAMNIWTSSANDASKAMGAFHGAMSGAQAGAAFGPWGVMIGAAGGALLGFIHTLDAGRRAVKDFAAEFDTAAAGTGFDELHAKLLSSLGDVGEQFWIQLTQQVRRGDKAGAAAVIANIRRALDEAAAKDPATLAAAAGYHTMEDLQDVADKAKAVYDYMVKSGKYSASQIADAFKKASEAQIAALGDEATAASKAIEDMNGKLKTLNESIANEAPEEVMGDIEKQVRAQIEAITAARDAAQAALDETVNAASDAAEKGLNEIDQALAEHDFVANLRWKYDLPNPQENGNVPGFAGGTEGFQDFGGGNGTLVRLHGWEKVTPRGKDDSGGGTIIIHNYTHLDGKQVADNQVKHLGPAMKRRGIR